jgi:hypothetical protein
MGVKKNRRPQACLPAGRLQATGYRLQASGTTDNRNGKEQKTSGFFCFS